MSFSRCKCCQRTLVGCRLYQTTTAMAPWLAVSFWLFLLARTEALRLFLNSMHSSPSHVSSMMPLAERCSPLLLVCFRLMGDGHDIVFFQTSNSPSPQKFPNGIEVQHFHVEGRRVNSLKVAESWNYGSHVAQRMFHGYPDESLYRVLWLSRDSAHSRLLSHHSNAVVQEPEDQAETTRFR